MSKLNELQGEWHDGHNIYITVFLLQPSPFPFLRSTWSIDRNNSWRLIEVDEDQPEEDVTLIGSNAIQLYS